MFGFACIAIALLGINLTAFAMTQCLHIITRGTKHDTRLTPLGQALDRNTSPRPFVSIHVPSYDEPPALVAETLHSLSRLDYPRFEVILLDNNTPDEETWRPLERLCRTLGSRFRFIHVAGLEGAKAGALNLCLKESDPRAQYVAVVDADYQVEANFLAVAIDRLLATKAAFVQFPQAFRGAADASAAVALELEDYFSVLARQAPAVRTPLLTGTLSVISREALAAAGGWSDASVTEDAELGVRLFAAGKIGHFCNIIVGRGLLPVSLDGLKTQRRRWVLGNTQTLWLALTSGLLVRRAGASSVLAQLTAWPAFWLLPIAVLLVTPFAVDADPSIALARRLAAATILASAAMAVGRGIANRRRELPVWRGVAGPLAVKLALVWVSSTAWFEIITRTTIPFVKTPKAPASIEATPVTGLGLALICLGAGGFYLARGEALAAAACLLAALSWPAARWVDTGLKHYGARQARPATAPEALPCTA